MTSPSPWITAIPGLVLGTAAVLLAGRAWSVEHVREVTGRTEVSEELGCLRCHGSKGSPTWAAGKVQPDPSALAASPDGETLYVACRTSKAVAVLDLSDRTLRARVLLEGNPRGLAVSPDGETLAVSLGSLDQVLLIDCDSLEVKRRIEVGAEPIGLAFAHGGKRLFVANSLSDDVSVVDPALGVETHRLAAGREPYTVVASPDGKQVAVVSRMATIDAPDALFHSEVTLIDAAEGVVTARIPLPSCHLAESAAFVPDGSQLLVPAIRTRNLLPILQVARGWVMSSVLAVIDVPSGRVALLPLGEVNRGFADPMGIAVSAAGDRAFVASGGGDQVAVIDLGVLRSLAREAEPDRPERLSLTREYVLERFDVGDLPAVLAIQGEGADVVLAVAERLDDAVAFFDAGGRLLARVPLDPGVSDDDVRRGERVFHDASYAFQAAFSCRSCHPDGHTDGLTYDFDIDGVGRNILLNRSLRGVAGTAPFKWIGLNQTLQRQCGPRFALVLTRADPFPEERLEELVAYIRSLPPPRPLPQAGQVAGRDTGSVARGRRIFERRMRKDGTPIPPADRCSTCHAPPLYTNLLKADVGTRSPTDSSGEFDVPHLLGTGSKAPYLHDGRARTLEEIWTLPGVEDQHGVLTDLNKAELNDLVSFLRGL